MPIDLPPFDVPPGYVREESGLIKKKAIMPGVFGGMVGLMGSAGKVVSQTATTILLTSGTTWSVPADWNWEDPGPNGYANWIDCYGGGGGGGDNAISSTGPGGGGGGGGFARVYNLACTPGGTLYYSIGAGGTGGGGGHGGITWCNRVSNAAPTLTSQGAKADRGLSGSNGTYEYESYYPGTGGNGGLVSNEVGDVKRQGGTGATGVPSSGGGGGGGCAGTSSNGSNGSSTSGGNGGGGYAGNGGNSNQYGYVYGGGGGGGHGAKATDGKPGRPGCILISYYPYI